MSKGTKLLHHKIATQIEHQLDEFPGAYLPSMVHLCKRFGCSRPTLIKALSLLREKGLLQYHQGERAKISSKIPPERADSPSWIKLYKLLTERIRVGEYRRGEALPKLSAIAADLNVSPSTVAKAVKALVEDSVLIKSGRTFYHSEMKHSLRSSVNRPSILVIVPRFFRFRSMLSSPMDREFAQTFLREADGVGIRLVQALPGKTSYAHQGFHICGMKSIQTELMKENFLGALLIGKPQEYKNWTELLTMLTWAKRPVAWFDRDAQGFGDKENPGHHIVRYRSSPRKMIELSLEYLQSYGHKKVLYTYRNALWRTERARMLERANKKIKGDITVAYRPWLEKSDWEDAGKNGTVETLKALHQKGPQALKHAISQIIKHRTVLNDLADKAISVTDPKSIRDDCSPFDGLVMASLAQVSQKGWIDSLDADMSQYLFDCWTALNLAPAILDASMTAIISPNDAQATNEIQWFYRMGLKPGRDISLISFDNNYIASGASVSSVDPGFERLGYRAFHQILGDLPLNKKQANTVTSTPFVVDRDTVAMIE